MSKPARLHPKKEPMKINPKVIFIGSISFAVLMGWIGIATNYGVF